jgi:hypothetical protein
MTYLLGALVRAPYLLGGGGLIGLARAMVFALIGYAVAAFVFCFFAGLFKGRKDFNRALAALTLAAVPGSVGTVLSSIPFVGWLISLGLGIYSLVLLYRIQPLYLEVPEDSQVVHFVASLLGTMIAVAVVSVVLGIGATASW